MPVIVMLGTNKCQSQIPKTAKQLKIAENSSTWRLRIDSMPSKKPRVMVYLSEEDKKELDQWAKEETRTVNNLITRLIENALSEKRQKQTQAKAKGENDPNHR